MTINRRELMHGIVASAATSLDIEAFASSEQGLHEEFSRIRPRLYLNRGRLARLRERFATDKDWADTLRHDGDRMLAANFIPESVAEVGGGQQAHYGQPAHQIAFMSITLGLLYQLTKDDRYAKQLHEALIHYGSYKRWGGPGLADRNPPWHSELDTSQFCFGYAVAYDTLYSYLSVEQRQQIRETTFQLGILPTLNDWILPGKRFHSLDSMGHNWWGVCVSGAGVAALAFLGEDSRVRQWIETIDDGFVEWFCYQGNVLHNRIETFEPDGPSYEGVNYTNYGITSYLRYLLAWKTMFPGQTHPTQKYLTGLPEFFLHTSYPTSKGALTVNFDDAHEGSTAADCILLLHACGIDNEYGENYLLHAHGAMGDPLPLYVPDKPNPTANKPLLLSKVYPKMGWAMMRNSWEPGATLLAVKSGYTWNHAHADASTFLLMHGGSSLIIDSGTCNYGRPEYSDYYRQSIAHNVVLFGGEGQPKDQINIGSKFRGSITNWFDGLGVRYIGADATGPMAYIAERHFRHFLWIGDVILIFDDIAAHRDVTLDWLFHTQGTARQDHERSLIVQNEGAEVLIRSLYPVEGKLEQREGLAPGDPDRRIPYHAFVFRTRERRQRMITALDLNPKRRTPIEVHERDECLELIVRAKDEIHHVYLNLRSMDGSYNMSSTISIEDWITDAYLLVLSYPANEPIDGSIALPQISRFFVLDGSFVRHQDDSVLECISKTSCLWSPVKAEVYTQSQPRSNFKLYWRDALRRVNWNGVPAGGRYDANSHLLHLRSQN